MHTDAAWSRIFVDQEVPRCHCNGERAGVDLGLAKAGDEPRHNWLPMLQTRPVIFGGPLFICSISGQVRALHFTAVVLEHEQPEHR